MHFQNHASDGMPEKYILKHIKLLSGDLEKQSTFDYIGYDKLDPAPHHVNPGR